MLDWRGMVDNLNEKENEGGTDNEPEKVEWSWIPNPNGVVGLTLEKGAEYNRGQKFKVDTDVLVTTRCISSA